MLKNKTILILNSLFCLLSLVILIDFVWPGEVIHDEVLDVVTEEQKYYNAAKNNHYSYRAITNKHEFWVSKEFSSSNWESEKIEYSVSILFNEVNWYQLRTSKSKSFYSLRIVSGAVIPLLVLLVIFISFQFKKNLEVLTFVFYVLLILDLVFLIL
ncbi:hypothetical protein [Mesonia mobilis]|uniref:hypothetical protein n=1 Tax=Mesonia mobilis TaxID=369791 RepID=UPI0026EF403D|nr:hypothetical protein [Mesonia mobilis]